MQFQMGNTNSNITNFLQITCDDFCFNELIELLLIFFCTFSLKKNNFLVLTTHGVSKQNPRFSFPALPLLKLCLEGLMKRTEILRTPISPDNAHKRVKWKPPLIFPDDSVSANVHITSQKLPHAMDSLHPLRTP